MTWSRPDIPEPVRVVLYTNRNLMAFNRAGEQIVEIQSAINCRTNDQKMVMDVANSGAVFEIAKWQAWTHRITREEFICLMGYERLL